MQNRTISRASAVAAVAFTLVLAAACGSSGSSQQSSGGTNATTATTPKGTTAGSTPGSVPVSTNTIAAQLVFGAGSECPQRDYCLKGLENTYGLTFKDVKSLDSGGPLTVAALKDGTIQVGLIFTSSGQIAANNWTLLEDDKHLQPADHVTPVVNDSVVTAYGDDLKKVVDALSAKITTEDLVQLDKAVEIDKEDADAAAKAWLEDKKILPSTTPATKSGPTIVVGSADFAESKFLAELYAQTLQANGYPVDKKLGIGSREIYFPSLEKGEITFVPDYAGTLLTFIDSSKSPTSDADKTYAELTDALKGKGVTAYAYAPAEDKNGFVVTADTAKKYNLKTLSDLAKPAS
jgi:osmoprotectant transport system substrate-binding protein